MTFVAFLMGFGYALVVLVLAMEGFTYKPKAPAATKDLPIFQGVSIIINFRNEQEHLPQLLASIVSLSYARARFEVLFINDASTDRSVECIQKVATVFPDINLHIYDRIVASASAKKDGITQAVQHAKYQHLITTDADCVLPTTWLAAFEAHYTQFPDSIFVAAPVQITADNTVKTQLQACEMVALQLVTMGGFAIGQPFLSNGANMSFTKATFHEMAGYTGNDHIASGDDIFLLEKSAAHDALSCYYLKSKDAIVRTHAKTTWSDLVTQRARWAQKGSKTKSMLNKLVSAQVFATNLFVLLSPLWLATGTVTLKAVATVVVLKVFTDALVLVMGHLFFENKRWQWFFVPQLVVYPLIIAVVAAASFTAVPWKGRVAPE